MSPLATCRQFPAGGGAYLSELFDVSRRLLIIGDSGTSTSEQGSSSKVGRAKVFVGRPAGGKQRGLLRIRPFRAIVSALFAGFLSGQPSSEATSS